MNIDFGTIIGFLLFLAIFGVVLYKFYGKIKKEVPPETLAKIEQLENIIHNKINKI